MSQRFIAKAHDAAVSYTGSHAGFGVDYDDNRLYVNPAGSRSPINHDQVAAKAASFTATSVESGTTFVADSTTSVVVQLPATAKGLKYTLVVGQLTSSSGHAFSPAAADKIIGNGFTPADDTDVVCTANTDRLGDSMTLVGDGVDGWYVVAVTGTWANS
jgi:acyl-homoserine lactone acylase PvdQ